MTPTNGRNIILTTFFILLLIPLVILIGQAISIWLFGYHKSSARADAAIVLGARLIGGRPSPVYRERINHGIDLLRRRRVRCLILSGGAAHRWGRAEAEAALEYALENGAYKNRILLETESNTTLQNMLHSRRIMEKNDLRTALIVTDPIHIKRSYRMARDAGITCRPSPTPTTRFLSYRKRIRFLLREVYAYNRYRLFGY